MAVTWGITQLPHIRGLAARMQQKIHERKSVLLQLVRQPGRRMAPGYSSRNVFAGSIEAILNVGRAVAATVTMASMATTARRLGQSYTLTP